MSAAANAAAFLSMRRRLFPEQGAALHPPVQSQAAPRARPVRVAAVDPQVRVSYRKRRWSPE